MIAWEEPRTSGLPPLPVPTAAPPVQEDAVTDLPAAPTTLLPVAAGEAKVAGDAAALWNEQRSDPLPLELHRRLVCSHPSSSPPPLPCSPFPRPFRGLRHALRRPPWHAAPVRGRLERVWRRGIGTAYHMYIELPGYRLHVMTARKLGDQPWAPTQDQYTPSYPRLCSLTRIRFESDGVKGEHSQRTTRSLQMSTSARVTRYICICVCCAYAMRMYACIGMRTCMYVCICMARYTAWASYRTMRIRTCPYLHASTFGSAMHACTRDSVHYLHA